MISASDRQKSISLIDEAVAHGAHLFKACELLGITERIYFRWKTLLQRIGDLADLRPSAEHSAPANKISEDEEHEILTRRQEKLNQGSTVSHQDDL